MIIMVLNQNENIPLQGFQAEIIFLPTFKLNLETEILNTSTLSTAVSNPTRHRNIHFFHSNHGVGVLYS